MPNTIHFPKLFRGIYAEREARYGPLILEARASLSKLGSHADAGTMLRYQILENPQPSFLLIPFMFLAAADMTGGVKKEHRDYLPTILLFSELWAVADDTVDRSLTRSDRLTFPARFGDASAVPFALLLAGIIAEQSAYHPQLSALVRSHYQEFFALEVWERANIYPEPSVFPEWLRRRYMQATLATELALNAAAIISGTELWPREAVILFSAVGQDVDDIVNLIECRVLDGENDDLQSGIVTRPLLLAIENVPDLLPRVLRLWSEYRDAELDHPSIRVVQTRRDEVTKRTRDLYTGIRDDVVKYGVPQTIEHCAHEVERAETMPTAFRSLTIQLAQAFADRLHRTVDRRAA